MSHGAGGKATQTLIEAVFLDTFRNPRLEQLDDAARLDIVGTRIVDTLVGDPLPRIC
jgi:hydrogenase expression/formation protein HypE